MHINPQINQKMYDPSGKGSYAFGPFVTVLSVLIMSVYEMSWCKNLHDSCLEKCIIEGIMDLWSSSGWKRPQGHFMHSPSHKVLLNYIKDHSMIM